MFNDNLIEIFDDCVTRMDRGETIEDCLRSYPQHATTLQPMLEATRIPRRAQAPSDEVNRSQQRVGQQFEQALNQPYRLHQPSSFPLSRLAAVIVLVFFLGSLLTTGAVIVAQDAIPGDTLYGVKRLSEQMRLIVAQDETALREEFAQRRIEETRQVINIGRETTVQFSGVIEQIGDMSIAIAGLEVETTSEIRTIELLEGMRVEILARTTVNQQIIASDVRILDLPDPIVQPNATPTTEASRPSVTPTTESSPTSSTPEVESNRLSSRTPQPRSTSTATAVQPTATRPHMTSTETGIDSTTLTRDACVPPSDWIEYTIQPGDTPSGIAVGTDLSLEELYAVNCDLNPRLIVVGDVIYVPFEPRLASPATLTPTPLRSGGDAVNSPLDRPADPTQAHRPTATDDDTSDDEEKQRRNRNNNSGGDDRGQRGR